MTSQLEAAIKSEDVGFALIITNDYNTNTSLQNLEATKSDGQAMKTAFEQLGYATIHQHNATLIWLLSSLKKLDRIRYPPSCKRLAFVFAGHGREPKGDEEGTQLVTSEGRTISVNTIVKYMSPGDSSSTIGDRVRMFFIDACRGDIDDQGRSVMVHRGGKLASECRVSIGASNYILCYSTLAGFRSYEIREDDNSHGVWLPVVANKLTSCDKSINDVMVEVNSHLLAQFQDSTKYPSIMQPTTSSTLNDTTVNLFREKPEVCTSIVSFSLPDQNDSLSSASHPQVIQPSLTLPTSSLARAPAVSSPKEPLIRLSSTPPKGPGIAAKFSSCSSTSSLPTLQPHQSMPPNQRQISCGAGVSARYHYHQPQLDLLPTNAGLVNRCSTQLPSGEHRDLLNRLVQNNVITLSTYKHEDKQLQTRLYKSTVNCTVVRDSTLLTGDSKGYYPKKGLADEKAAEDILKQLQHIGISISASGKSRPTPTPISPPSTRIYKQHVNNHFQGMLMLALPVYDTNPSKNGFQCVITHPMFPSLIRCESIKGNICSSKKDAENSAAWRVWTIINGD